MGQSLRRLTVGVDEIRVHRVVPNQRRELLLSDSTVEDHRLSSVVFGTEDIRRGATDLRRNLQFPLWIVITSPKVHRNSFLLPVPVVTP